LFWGRHGTGRVTYGQHGQPGIDDICYPDQGWHAAPYVYRVWAYNIDDLIAVKNGTKQRWDPRPYQQWDWTFPFGSGCAEVEGVAYDPPTRRIFITQAYGDGPALPIVYVYIAQAGAGPQPPASPTNVRIVR